MKFHAPGLTRKKMRKIAVFDSDLYGALMMF